MTKFKIHFYKYKPLQNNEHDKHLQNFLDQNIYFSPLHLLNDPFEGCCKVKITPQETLENPQLKDHFFRIFQEVDPDLTLDEFEKLILEPNFINELEKKQEKLVSVLFQNHGLLSLAQKNSNIPMWAHYAQDHQGYCVIFELDFDYIARIAKIRPDLQEQYMDEVIKGNTMISFESGGFEFRFCKVRYSDEPPVLDLGEFWKLHPTCAQDGSYEQDEYIIKNSIGVKYSQWGYEEEYRLISSAHSEKSGLAFLRSYAPFLKVTGIILGTKMPDGKKKHVQQLCEMKHIPCYQAYHSESDYRIEEVKETESKVLLEA